MCVLIHTINNNSEHLYKKRRFLDIFYFFLIICYMSNMKTLRILNSGIVFSVFNIKEFNQQYLLQITEY